MDAGKGKWPVIIWWVVCHVYMVCYDFYDFFFVISLHFGMKRRKRKVYLFQEEKKKKKEKKKVRYTSTESNPG